LEILGAIESFLTEGGVASASWAFFGIEQKLFRDLFSSTASAEPGIFYRLSTNEVEISLGGTETEEFITACTGAEQIQSLRVGAQIDICGGVGGLKVERTVRSFTILMDQDRVIA